MLTLLYVTAILVACFRLSVSIQSAGQRQTGCSPVTKSLEQPSNYYVWDIKNKETTRVSERTQLRTLAEFSKKAI